MPADLQSLLDAAPAGAVLHDLASLTPDELEALLDTAEPGSTLDDVLRRLFDRSEDADRPVSAFSSAL